MVSTTHLAWFEKFSTLITSLGFNLTYSDADWDIDPYDHESTTTCFYIFVFCSMSCGRVRNMMLFLEC